MFYRLCHVHETSPGTHTFFPTYTCPVYCWRSVQLLDFSLFCNLIHASQPIRATFTGQCFASGFLQTPPRDDALAISCTLPTAGRVKDFHLLERVPAGHTEKPEILDLQGFRALCAGVPGAIRTRGLSLRRTIEHLSSVFTYVQESRYPSGFFRIPSRSVSIRVHLCR